MATVLLARRVADEVHWPTKDLLNENTGQVVKRGILEEIVDFFKHALILAVCGSLLLLRLDSLAFGLQANLCASLGYKDLVSLHRAGCGVVTGMADSPAVVGDEEGRVAYPTDGIVDGLAG